MTGTVILFAGHRLDEPGRDPPRFPADCESKVREAIRSVLCEISAAGPSLAMAGAADGVDILFHEVCDELGIASEVCLALPPSEYLSTSVQRSWAERFQRLLATHPTATLEVRDGHVWQTDHEWQIQRARDRSPSRILLLALLEESEVEAPGGTLAMVRATKNLGLEVVELNIREICR